MQYKNKGMTLPAIAAELGVDYVLEGTVRWVRERDKQKVRISPQLIQVSDDRHIWAEKFDRDFENIFLVQTEIATRVAHSLGLVLRQDEQRVIATVPTRNLDAYQAYLRGMSSGPDYEENNTRMALEMYQQAVKLDSTFALAYAALASAHTRYYWEGFDRSPERLAAGKRALDKALALQPDLPEAQRELGMYYYRGFRDYEKALEALTKYEKMRPSDGLALSSIAYIWRRQGRFDEAADQLQKALRLNPRSAGMAREIGNTLFQLGRYPEAEVYMDQAIDLQPDQRLTYELKSNMYLRWHGDTKRSRNILKLAPTIYSPWDAFIHLEIYDRNFTAALNLLSTSPGQLRVSQHEIVPVTQLRGLVYRFLGDTVRSRTSFDSSRVILESEIARRPDDYRLLQSLAITLAGLGRRDEALRIAVRATEAMPASVDAVAGVWPQISYAEVLVMVGHTDAALDKLEYLLSLRGPKYITPPFLRLDPIYDALRSDARFQALLKKYART